MFRYALALLLVAGCGGQAGSQVAHPDPTSHDEPVPAGVKRAQVGLLLSLPPAADCEEQFDLELYRERGVDMIDWDDGRGCVERGVDITYLPERLARPKLMQRVKDLATVIDRQQPEKAPQ